MHRVELKVPLDSVPSSLLPWFLMHRVELKVLSVLLNFLTNNFNVPNAPCGVERPYGKYLTLSGLYTFLMHRVELKGRYPLLRISTELRFLMHRVELKARSSFACLRKISSIVPNAPCGVESTFESLSSSL